MNLSDTKSDEVVGIVRLAMHRRRRAIVYSIARKLFASFEGQRSFGKCLADNDDEWIQIESLSQLRTVVGGRFRNIKEKWMSAGLPLRQHRGDRSQEAQLNQEGWIELALWIDKQGFDARIADDKSSGLFEVRKKQ